MTVSWRIVMHTTGSNCRFGAKGYAKNPKAHVAPIMNAEHSGNCLRLNPCHQRGCVLVGERSSSGTTIHHLDIHGLPEGIQVGVSDGKKVRILVVEDNPFFGQLLESFLQIAGYEPIVADSGEKAVEIFGAQKNDISMVVLDLLMPRMSGKDCLMKLLELNPQVKVMVVSVLDPADSFCKDITPYVKDFIRKPCRMADFIQQTRRLLVN